MASSKKLAGRCIAGISNTSGGWVRPVSSLPGGLRKFQCEVDGQWPEPLDIVRFGYEERLDDPAQPENVLIDDADWQRVGRLPSDGAYQALRGHLAPGPLLFGNRGAAVTENIAAEGMEASLALIEPDSVEFLMKPAEETQGKLKPRVSFRLGGGRRLFELNLTDYFARPLVLAAGCGTYSVEDLDLGGKRILLTVSLAEAHKGWHSKLAAAVVPVS